MNHWLQDWVYENPPNGGPNWKCCQEVSIRLIRLCLACFLMKEQASPEPALTRLIYESCQRIKATHHYAMAQDNNHGTSEAASLFIGGVFLQQCPTLECDHGTLQTYHDFEKTGLYWLENRIKKLVLADSSFSQYSVVYHQLMLDTLSITERFRAVFKRPVFSERFYERACVATRWLYIMANPLTGRSPNTELKQPFVKGKRTGVVDSIHVIEFDIPYTNDTIFLKRSMLFLQFSLKGIRVALIEPYDVLLATSTPLTVAIPGLVARWLRNKCFIFEVRDPWPELPRAMGVIKNPVALWAMGLLEWSAYKSAHRLIGLSPGIVSGIAKRNIQASRISMIPNGYDLLLFAQDKIKPWHPKGGEF